MDQDAYGRSRRTRPGLAGAETLIWLATSDEPSARLSGRYVKDRQHLSANPAACDQGLQDGLLRGCAVLSGVRFPT
jgi:hypothetical protein